MFDAQADGFDLSPPVEGRGGRMLRMIFILAILTLVAIFVWRTLAAMSDAFKSDGIHRESVVVFNDSPEPIVVSDNSWGDGPTPGESTPRQVIEPEMSATISCDYLREVDVVDVEEQMMPVSLNCPGPELHVDGPGPSNYGRVEAQVERPVPKSGCRRWW